MTETETDSDLVLEMRRRVRRHMLTSLGGIVFGFFLLVGVGGGMRASGVTGPVAALPVLGVLIIPAVGWWSTFKNIRCPSCDRLVVWIMSSNYSVFGSMAPKHCPGCGKQIFSAASTRRFFRMVFIFVGIGVALAVLGGVASAMMRPHH